MFMPVIALVSLSVVSVGPEPFQKPFAIKAGEVTINVDIGHAAPFMVDMDGDGKRDLLVGQFGGGKLRVYRNIGSDETPAFSEFTWFDGVVPSG